jgi:hypothetical protein
MSDFIQIVVAMYHPMYPPVGETGKPACTCARHRAPHAPAPPVLTVA